MSPALRELALLWLAATLADGRRRHQPGRPLSCVPHDRERMVVALASGTDGESLIRRAARLAARSGADLLAVHVARPGRPAGPGLGAPATQAQLVRSLGGSYHELSDDNIPAALLTFAQAENATQYLAVRSPRTWSPELAALVLGRAAPYPVLLAGAQRELTTRSPHRATSAHGEGFGYLPPGNAGRG